MEPIRMDSILDFIRLISIRMKHLRSMALIGQQRIRAGGSPDTASSSVYKRLGPAYL